MAVQIILFQIKTVGIPLVINFNFVVKNLHAFSGQAYDSLYEKLRGILGVSEYYHVAPRRIFEPIAYLVNQQVISVIKTRLHLCSFYKKRLYQIIPDWQNYSKRNDHDFQGLPN